MIEQGIAEDLALRIETNDDTQFATKTVSRADNSGSQILLFSILGVQNDISEFLTFFIVLTNGINLCYYGIISAKKGII